MPAAMSSGIEPNLPQGIIYDPDLSVVTSGEHPANNSLYAPYLGPLKRTPWQVVRIGKNLQAKRPKSLGHTITMPITAGAFLCSSVFTSPGLTLYCLKLVCGTPTSLHLWSVLTTDMIPSFLVRFANSSAKKTHPTFPCM